MEKTQENILTYDLTHPQVVTLAVYLLGGSRSAVDTEDVAVRANELAPGRFSWRKYRDQINLELVRVYLSDAKKEQHGAMLIGAGRSGWRLTQSGLDWASKVAPLIGHVDLSRSRAQVKSGSIDEKRWQRERARILTSKAWDLWLDDKENITINDAKKVFRVDSYVTGQLLETKITRILSLFYNDDELNTFLKYIANLVREEKPEP